MTTRTRATISRNREDRRVWPDWLSVRACVLLITECEFTHPSDLLAFAPSDFNGVYKCGPKLLQEIARLYREQAEIVGAEWAALETADAPRS